MSALLRIASATLAGLLLLTACSGSGGSSASSPAPSATKPSSSAPVRSKAAPSSSAPARSASPKSTSATGGSLSGAWNGQYNGQYSGTFRLTWTQKGRSLAGTIVLSQPSSTLHLTGHLNGSRITFGTLGSAAITYTGDVTGDQIVGSYAVGGHTAGTWRANHA